MAKLKNVLAERNESKFLFLAALSDATSICTDGFIFTLTTGPVPVSNSVIVNLCYTVF